MSFDPYHQWLGIPQAEQPADCYRLLGIRRFEQNATAISNAAERQLLMLQTMQTGPHGATARDLISEVKAARVLLLDREKKSQYDAELRVVAGGDPSFHLAALSPAGEKHSEQPPVGRSVSAVRPASGSTRGERRNQVRPIRRAIRRSKHGSKRVQVSVWVVSAVLVAAALAIVVLWVSVGNPKRGDSSSVANGHGNRTARDRTTRDRAQRDRAQRDAVHDRSRFARPPATPFQRSRARETESAPTTSRLHSSQPEMAESGVSEAPTKPPQADGPRESHLSIASPDDRAARSSRDEASHAGADEHAAMADGTPDIKKRVAEKALPDDSEATSQSESEAFSQLSSQLNLAETVAATGSGYVFIGELASPPSEAWQLRIEDFASPAGGARFSVGPMSHDDEITCWPLSRVIADESASGESGVASTRSRTNRCGRVEASPSKLALWLADPKDQELIDDLSLCGLVIENGKSRHLVQFSVPRHIAPVTLVFDKSRQTITLEHVPAVGELSSTRIVLDILKVDFGEGDEAVSLPAHAGYGKELTVATDNTLHCELGITLTKSAGQFCIAIIPRFIRNGRKQPLVAAKITKEVSRAKSQLARSQRDLNAARNVLRVLPSELRRVRGIVPRTPPEVAARQASLGQLASRIDSMQSRVRRLSKVIPNLVAGIEQMNRVLEYVNGLAGQGTLHFRIYLQGDFGEDELLLLATSTSQ